MSTTVHQKGGRLACSLWGLSNSEENSRMCYAWLTVPVHIFLPQVFIQMHCHIINSFLRKLHLCKKKKREWTGCDFTCSVFMKLNLNFCLCQVALLVQFLIENSGEIFGGDIASLFQRPDKKKSKNSEESLGKLMVVNHLEIFKIF